MGRGKRQAMSFDEMTDYNNENVENQLAKGKNSTLYKAQTRELQKTETIELIDMKLAQLRAVEVNKKVSLTDVEDVKKRTILYLQSCRETGTYPNNSGLARVLGYTARALRHWRTYKPDTPTGEWLQMFSELCAEVLNESALNNNCNAITSIFLSKALYD